jgi:predicted DNA-binding transcriptional regulator YafY
LTPAASARAAGSTPWTCIQARNRPGENTSAYRYQARFTLHASAATERIAPTTANLEPIEEHSCTLRAGSNSLDELTIYVAGKGFDFQVHEPPELVEHVKTLASRLARATDY